MNDTYNQLQSEKIVEENEQCRLILSEINNFGISDRQRQYLIYLLALELENHDCLRIMIEATKECNQLICEQQGKIFLLPEEEK